MPGTCLAGAATTIRNFQQLRSAAGALGALRVAIVCADDDVVLAAAWDAFSSGIATPQLIGDGKRIRARAQALGLERLLAAERIIDVENSAQAALAACKMAASGETEILLKGHLRTDELLHVLLDQGNGLRTGRLLSDVLLYEDVLSGEARLVAITDGGVNVLPSLDEKRQIVLNAIDVLRSIGIARSRIALMSAIEVVSERIHSTVDALALTGMAERGEFGEAMLYGPLALDDALVPSAARAKGITNQVAGKADCLVVPNIEAGNLLGKAAKYLGYSQCAHVVVGARVPVLIPSRAESSDDKVNAMALGVVFRAHSLRYRSEVQG